ncbi:MAG: hypothetical protein RIB80_03275 [Rhodospirillales bacterium]
MSDAQENETFDLDEHSRSAPADQPKTRSCLRCDTRFMSAWSGERICPRCKGSSAWRSDAPIAHRT